MYVFISIFVLFFIVCQFCVFFFLCKSREIPQKSKICYACILLSSNYRKKWPKSFVFLPIYDPCMIFLRQSAAFPCVLHLEACQMFFNVTWEQDQVRIRWTKQARWHKTVERQWKEIESHCHSLIILSALTAKKEISACRHDELLLHSTL